MIAALAGGCASEESVSSDQQHLISDQFHGGGVVGFMFLPPLVAAPTFGGPAEPAASPTVRIDELDASGTAVRTILTAPAVLTDEHFRYQWDTDDHVLSTESMYRIGVLVPGGRRLGFVDVDLLASKHEVRNVNTSELVPLVDGKKLNIAFRIERGAVDLDGDSVLDWLDGCPDDAAKTSAGACGCGVPDTDTDSDGSLDCADVCPSNPAKAAPGACGCDFDDVDADGDGTAWCQDQCEQDDRKTEEGQCGCGRPDLDSDADGLADCLDECWLDPSKVAPGRCGCGVTDANTDGDWAPDCHDRCPLDPLKLEPGECGCGEADLDEDGDGVLGCDDGCDLDPAKLDPGICGCGVTDTDADADGAADCHDACTFDDAKTEPGVCGCGFRDDDADGCREPATGNICATTNHPLIVAAEIGWALPQASQDNLTSNREDLVVWASSTTDSINRCLATYIYNAAYVHDTRYVDQNWYDPAQAQRTELWVPGCGDAISPPPSIRTPVHNPYLAAGFIPPAGYNSDPGNDGMDFTLRDLWASQWVIEDVACACTAELAPLNPLFCGDAG